MTEEKQYAPRSKMGVAKRKFTANGVEIIRLWCGGFNIVMFREPEEDDDWGEAFSVYAQEGKPREKKPDATATRQQRYGSQDRKQSSRDFQAPWPERES